MNIGETDVTRRSLDRSENRKTLLQTILDAGTVSRVELATLTRLSRPTVNSIVTTLEREGLVEDVGSITSKGRSAAIYRVISDARVVLGIDLGGSTIRGAVADLNGQIRSSREIPTRSGKESVLRRLMKLSALLLEESGAEAESLASVTIGVPGAPNRLTGAIDYAVSIPELEEIDLGREYSSSLQIPVRIENDVNMAILGERWRGHAQKTVDAVFIAVGNGLGVGIVSGGRLQRGHRGLSGEIDALPIERLNAHKDIEDFSLEAVVTSRGIVSRWSKDPQLDGSDVPKVFEEASKGSSKALEAIDQSAWYLANIISVLQGILDPERVIMGGGVGAHPILMDTLRSHLTKFKRYPPVVETSALDGGASLLGALAVALADARAGVGLDPTRVISF